MSVEPPELSGVCVPSSCRRCLIDSTGATSGIDSFAIRWSMADGGGLMDGIVVRDGFVCSRGTRLVAGMPVVAFRPSINFLTVSDIFGWGGFEALGFCVSGIVANLGAERGGGDDFGTGDVVVRS